MITVSGGIMAKVAVLHPPRQLVLFRVGETHYGLDIEAVGEILPVLPVTALPGAPAGVIGIADVRERVVPVFDLHWKFGVPTPGSNPEARLILVRAGEGPVALLVGAVEEVVTVAREDFQSVTTPGSVSSLGYLNGVVRRGDRLVLWIDHARLVPERMLPAA